MSIGDKSNLMFTTGMTGFCLVARISEHGKDFVSGGAFESSFLRVVEPGGVLRHISFFHFKVTHEGFPATPRTAPEFLFLCDLKSGYSFFPKRSRFRSEEFENP